MTANDVMWELEAIIARGLDESQLSNGYVIGSEENEELRVRLWNDEGREQVFRVVIEEVQ